MRYFCVKKVKSCGQGYDCCAMSGRGTLDLIRVPQILKIIATYYVCNVLKPLLEKKIPKPYPSETHNVSLHHDAASSHPTRITAQYAAQLKEKLGISFIPNKEMPGEFNDALLIFLCQLEHFQNRFEKVVKIKFYDFANFFLEREKVTPEIFLIVLNSW